MQQLTGAGSAALARYDLEVIGSNPVPIESLRLKDVVALNRAALIVGYCRNSALVAERRLSAIGSLAISE